MTAVEREWRKIEKAEARLREKAERYEVPAWKAGLEEKLPRKLTEGLERAFARAFALLFEKGTAVIEKTYRREELEKDFQIRDYTFDVRRGRRELGQIRRNAGRSNALTAAFTTVEGVGLGLLGIGLPDVAVWLGVLLRSVYETALKYGFDYETPRERYLILAMMEASMRTGEDWLAADREVDNLVRTICFAPTEEALKEQTGKTSNAFAEALLTAKFVQGLPVVGAVGGAANPVYYRRVMGYVELKYRKRYLMEKR